MIRRPVWFHTPARASTGNEGNRPDPNLSAHSVADRPPPAPGRRFLTSQRPRRRARPFIRRRRGALVGPQHTGRHGGEVLLVSRVRPGPHRRYHSAAVPGGPTQTKGGS